MILEYEYGFAAYLFYRIKYDKVIIPKGCVLLSDVPLQDLKND